MAASVKVAWRRVCVRNNFEFCVFQLDIVNPTGVAASRLLLCAASVCKKFLCVKALLCVKSLKYEVEYEVVLGSTLCKLSSTK